MPDRLPLRAGPVTAQFDPASGWLRYVHAGGAEVLRAVYPAVRDRYWNTPPLRLAAWELTPAAGGFRLTFDAVCQAGEIDFAVTGEVTGDADGAIRFRFDGVARSTFLRNRIGLCVLHPAAVAGQACEVEHPDGSVTRTRFPEAICPHQPFRAVRAIRHEPAPRLSAEVRCDGDTFETEDQRNWTDPTFKTYSTPLAEPFPVVLRPGDRVSQVVTLRLLGRPAAAVELPPPAVRWTARRVPLPAIGFGTGDRPLSPTEVERLRGLRPSHLRADVSRADSARVEAATLGCRLELAARPEQLEAVGDADVLLHRGADPATPADVARARRPGRRVWVGSDLYFTHVNRRPPADLADGLMFSVNPQVHAFDDESVVETLDGQTAVLAAGTPVGIGPITLRPRYNPHGGPPLPPDPRQCTGFAAAWALASVRRLLGVERLTYFETTGPRGLMDGGEVFPAYHVFAALAGGAVSDPCDCSRPLVVEAVRLVEGGRSRTLVANLTPGPLAVPVSDEAGRVVRVLELDGYGVGQVGE